VIFWRLYSDHVLSHTPLPCQYQETSVRESEWNIKVPYILARKLENGISDPFKTRKFYICREANIFNVFCDPGVCASYVS
jgi:hypothetical protein